MWTEKLQVQGPYNFDLVLERLSLDPLQVVDFTNTTVKVPLYIEKEPIVLQVQAIGNIDEPSFIIKGQSEVYKSKAIERLKKVFHWHEPLEGVSRHFRESDLREIFEEHRGTAIVLDFDYYSCLVKCIIHQQLNLSFAHTLTERFVKTFGFQMEGAWFYPTPETTAQLQIEQLRAIQFSGRKAEYVIGLSEQIIQGHLNLDIMEKLSDQEVMDILIKIRGIGRWTAENFLLFGLGRPNLFPKADIGIQNALKILYGLPQKPTQEEMESYSVKWAPYLSYASLYLWRSIEKRSEKK
ncbi:DNA-3-methyladenine glycosylase family protein [Peribacillus frigoritolerans]|uniref:DNA-3-methyladenine glycosylase family protein n=1 Tax=Peribacillus frigoritolerans TaxID=450367 RepID=UPI003CFF1954